MVLHLETGAEGCGFNFTAAVVAEIFSAFRKPAGRYPDAIVTAQENLFFLHRFLLFIFIKVLLK